MEMMAYFAPLIPIAGIALLAFFIIGIGADAKAGGRHGLLQGFLMSVSLVTFGAAIASLVFLGNLGLRTVLPNADQQRSYDYPPAIFMASKDNAGPLSAALTCSDACELTETQKSSFNDWKQMFRDWQSRQSSPATRYARDLVNGLSVLIIAAPLFALFFRWVQRDARAGRAIVSMRSFYFYGFALIGLLATIVSGILLVNIGLRSVFLGADASATSVLPPRPYSPGDTASAETIINCGVRCGFSEADVALVREWQTVSQKTNPTYDRRQSDLATNLPILLAGLPVFLYHFITIRRETRADTPPSATPTTA